MSWEWTTATAFNLAGAVLVVVFGLIVASVRPRTPQATAVALFSVAFGAATGSTNLALVVGTDTVLGQWLGWMSFASTLAGAIALAPLWWLLPAPRRPSPRLLGLMAAFAIAGLALFSFPVLSGRVASPTLDALGPAIRLSAAADGPFFLLWWGLILLFAWRFAQGVEKPRETLLLACALVLFPAVNAGEGVGNDPVFALHGGIAFTFTLLSAAAWLWAGHRAGRAREGRVVAWLALGSALAALLASPAGGGLEGNLGLFGISRIATVAVLSYAVVRHQLLGIDVKVRWGISKSTVAAAFIAVFFVASEAAQQFFGETLGSTYVGIAAAGGLVFAMAPLQRAAERLAERAVPATSPAPVATRASSDKEEAYKRAVRLALRGRVTREEEVHLHEVAEHMGIGAGRAMALRLEVERETEAPLSQEAP